MKRFKYYIQPPLITLDGFTYWKGYKTYSEYNYLQPGIISYIKTRHFEKALELTSKHFHNCNVIDFGCGDGAFLPSLAKYFNSVVGIDKDLDSMKIATQLVKKTGIENVKLICNERLEIDDVKLELRNEEYYIMYLLETLEHIGNKPNIFESKIQFLRKVSNLLCDEGLIVISVPNMIGLPFLLQRLGLTLLNMNREPLSVSELIRASFFNDTSNLEKKWNGGHIGFNHQKLESYLGKEFSIIEKKNDFFQVIYLIKRKQE